MATYPNSIFFWTPRIDQQNIVFANDPNTLANEIVAIESTLGTNPHKEKHPPTGTGYTYRSVDSRISAANGNWDMPWATFYGPNFFIGQGQSLYNTYKPYNDAYGIWNGKDVTIPATGWYNIYAAQKWNQHGNNFRGGNVLVLYWNGQFIDAAIWDWDNFFGDTSFHYVQQVYQAQGFSRINFGSFFTKGDHLQFLSVNSTFCPGIEVTNIFMSIQCTRTEPTGTGFNTTAIQQAGTSI